MMIQSNPCKTDCVLNTHGKPYTQLFSLLIRPVYSSSGAHHPVPVSWRSMNEMRPSCGSWPPIAGGSSRADGRWGRQRRAPPMTLQSSLKEDGRSRMVRGIFNQIWLLWRPSDFLTVAGERENETIDTTQICFPIDKMAVGWQSLNSTINQSINPYIIDHTHTYAHKICTLNKQAVQEISQYANRLKI